MSGNKRKASVTVTNLCLIKGGCHVLGKVHDVSLFSPGVRETLAGKVVLHHGMLLSIMAECLHRLCIFARCSERSCA